MNQPKRTTYTEQKFDHLKGLGCLVDAFGVYASPVVGAFVQHVSKRGTSRIPAMADL